MSAALPRNCHAARLELCIDWNSRKSAHDEGGAALAAMSKGTAHLPDIRAADPHESSAAGR